MAPTPGILLVTMSPKSDQLTSAQFHDWYNNEHGPIRLRMPIFSNGYRYRAIDLGPPHQEPDAVGREHEFPEWMAIYDMEDMEDLNRAPYLALRGPPEQSDRERQTMSKIEVGRRLYDYAGGRTPKGYGSLDPVGAQGQGNVLLCVAFTLKDWDTGKKELDAWYEQEHIELVSRIPGWRRTRRFVTSALDPKGREEKECLAIHDFAPENGIGGEMNRKAVDTDWTRRIRTQVIKGRKRRVYELYYTFGPASRELGALSDPSTRPYTSTDGLTRTFPKTEGAIGGAIESYVTTPDGVKLFYRLEGSSAPDAPLAVLSNSILVEWGIWDGFLHEFWKDEANRKYRVLRYHTRGRTSDFGSKPITVDVLASDVIALLDALRVQKAAAVVGVSLGGATVLNVALKYPDRVASFVSCDTNANSPAGNEKAWNERIAVAESEAATTASGEKIVGEKLAELTVRRWFVKESYDDPGLTSKIARVKKMVETNNFDGFKNSVNALFAYDLRDSMKDAKVRGIFVVGSGDGILPGTMKEMAKTYGSKGTDCVVIDKAGHLPMVEQPGMFSETVGAFLKG